MELASVSGEYETDRLPGVQILQRSHYFKEEKSIADPQKAKENWEETDAKLS